MREFIGQPVNVEVRIHDEIVLNAGGILELRTGIGQGFQYNVRILVNGHTHGIVWLSNKAKILEDRDGSLDITDFWE